MKAFRSVQDLMFMFLPSKIPVTVLLSLTERKEMSSSFIMKVLVLQFTL